jgi:hypothetical protein
LDDDRFNADNREWPVMAAGVDMCLGGVFHCSVLHLPYGRIGAVYHTSFEIWGALWLVLNNLLGFTGVLGGGLKRQRVLTFFLHA